MQARGKVINKLALVLLSLVVLELVLIGDQVQPVKAIKKKIYLKKLKKILPLLALVKPKKKLILVPIPIPMFKKEPVRHFVQQVQPQMTLSRPMSVAGSNGAMSFMMVDPSMALGPALSDSSPIEASQMMTMPSMTMTIQSDGTGTMSAIELTPGASSANNSTPSTSGALIAAGRPSKWSEQQQHYDFQTDEQFSLNEYLQPIKQRPREGDHYYASPWANNAASSAGSRLPLVSPAKFVRNGRLKQQLSSWSSPSARRPSEASAKVQAKEMAARAPAGEPPGQATTRQQTIALITTSSQPASQQKQSSPTPSMPIVTIKSQWHHSGASQQQPPSATSSPNETPQGSEGTRTQQLGPKLSKQQEQQIASALEHESLVQVGPARLIPIYQSANGRISMTPPPAMLHTMRPTSGDQLVPSEHIASELNAEVQTNDARGNQLRLPPPPPHERPLEHDSSGPTSGEPMAKSGRLAAQRSKMPPAEGAKYGPAGTVASAY